MNSDKPTASLSLDLDNKWSYMKTHGDPGWESFPSYLDILIPRVLRFFADRKLAITCFVVGQDAALPKNRNSLQALAAAGHEIGNHSFSHEPWLHLLSKARIEEEFARTEDAIESITGSKPIGFRGPGFSFSPDTLRVLTERGYLYDASSFPTWIGPLARAYYFMSSNFGRDELKKRDALFGSIRDCFAPLNPHRLSSESGQLLEIPVTTMPFFRVPIHASYILYLSTFSTAFATTYFRSAFALCLLAGVQPSLLLHPLDFLGGDDVPDLAFFPAMNLRSIQKAEIMEKILAWYCDNFSVVTLREQASQLAPHDHPVATKVRQPRAAS